MAGFDYKKKTSNGGKDSKKMEAVGRGMAKVAQQGKVGKDAKKQGAV